MATSSRNQGSGSVLKVIAASALIAVGTSLTLTHLLGSGAATGTTGAAVARQAAQNRSGPATELAARDVQKSDQAGPPEAAIVTGAVGKKKVRYLDAAFDPIHFKPAIDKATNEQCLSCHQDILKREVRKTSPANVVANDTLAWYQTLDTYVGDQETFHARHLSTAFAKKVMNLKCNFCHQGHDPREEASASSATTTVADLGNFTLRKQINPSSSCLRCHGTFPATNMGLEGSWHELREGLESDDAPNGCLTCHAEQFRTVRHEVNYLNAKAIEDLAKKGSSDACFGCHGGRQWYRTSYPYPRHPWPGMDAEVPDWAKDRPTESAPQDQLKK